MPPKTPQFKLTLTDEQRAMLLKHAREKQIKSLALTIHTLLKEALAARGKDYPDPPSWGG